MTNMLAKLATLKDKVSKIRPEPAFHLNVVIPSPVYVFDLSSELSNNEIYTDQIYNDSENSKKDLVSNGYQSPYFFPSTPNFYKYKDLLKIVESKANLISDTKYQIQYFWYVIYENHGKQKWHSHKDIDNDTTKLSGVYYSKVDDKSSPIVFRDGTDNTVKFYPKPQQLILFHSYIEHMVLENNSNNLRIAFAFNFRHSQ